MRFFAWVGIIALSGFLYWGAFSAYFFQDDWFSLQISHVSSLREVGRFFIPRNDVIYYRPLGMQIPFFLLQKSVGLQSVYYHLLTFFFVIIASWSVSRLMQITGFSYSTSLWGALLYASSTVHYLPMYWTATIAFALGPIFVIWAIIFFLAWGHDGIFGHYLLSILMFMLGLLTFEMAIMTPVLIGCFILVGAISWKKLIWLLSYISIGGSMFAYRFFMYPPRLSGAYEQGLSVSIIHTIKWYVMWSMQWPEEIMGQFVTFFQFNGQFVSEFRTFLVIQIVATGVFLILGIWLFVKAMFVSGWNMVLQWVLFSVIWFFAGLGPVIFFVGHSFSYYLSLSLIGIIMLYARLFMYAFTKHDPRRTYWMVGVCSLWAIAAQNTMMFNAMIHWAPRRANNSLHLVKKSQEFYHGEDVRSFPFIYVRPSSENKLSLNDQDAFSLLYPGTGVKTIYGYVIDHTVL